MTETNIIPSWIDPSDPGMPDPEVAYFKGAVESVTYYNRRKTCVHRDGAPAEILYHKNGAKKCERWVDQAVLHRTDGPAVTEWDDEGNIIYCMWRRNGVAHRDGNDMPALERYYSTGELKSQCWYQGSNFHRTSGPAIIGYNKDGSISSQQFCENGVELPPFSQ